MILLYILLLICTYLLYTYGALNEYLALALSLASASAIVYYLFKAFWRRLLLFREGRRMGSRVYEVLHLAGMPILPLQELKLLVNEDGLKIFDKSYELEINREEIRDILLGNARELLPSEELSYFIGKYVPDIKVFRLPYSEEYLPSSREQLLVLALKLNGEKEKVFLLSLKQQAAVNKLQQFFNL